MGCGVEPVLALLIEGLIMMWGHQLSGSAWVGLAQALQMLTALQEQQDPPVCLLLIGKGMSTMLWV
jgi:hypothetical protein